jgi:hypothetical protein
MNRVVKASLSKPAYLAWPIAGLVVAACLAPSVVWVLSDSHVWWWDQALYGEATLRVWQTRLSGPGAWPHAVIGTLGGQQPLMVWLGQFFLPLRHMTGSFESALLLLNICAAGGTLILIYDVARRLGAGGAAGLSGVMVCAGSGLFIGLTHQYLVETVQCLAAAAAMSVALDAEKRSRAKTAALVIGVAALSFLSKASSMTFLLPMLCYIAAATWITRRKIRPAVRPGDMAWLAGAIGIAGLAVTWYAVHWQSMVQHFIEATTADFALHWGSPVNLPVKLSYWFGGFRTSLSPFVIVAAGMGSVVLAALVIAFNRFRGRLPAEWAEASVADGTLFVLATAGTIVATIFAFSLQINEDIRFLIPLMPMMAVLVAWSLATIRNRAVARIGFCGLALNVAVNHALSFGFALSGIAAAPHLVPIERNAATDAAALLTEAIHSTCHTTDAGPRLIVVNYATLNVNTINFYAAKESYATGFRCFYTTYNSFDPDLQHALGAIDFIAPAYIVTVAPEQQTWDSQRPDFANRTSRPVTEHLAHDPRYRLESSPGRYIQVYHRIDGPDG